MTTTNLQVGLRAALERAEAGSTKYAVLDRFRHMILELEGQAEAEATPEKTRVKILGYLDHLRASHEELGSRIFHVAFAVNVAGEGMVRLDLANRAVLDFLQVGLYFFGLDQIDRRWASHAAIYLGVHADHLTQFMGRTSIQDVIKLGNEKHQAGRVFCLTYTYLNSLRKAYWKSCRGSEDALDVAVTTEAQTDVPVARIAEPGRGLDSADRVALMLRIFDQSLTEDQRWIYLAKNRSTPFGDHQEEGPPAGLDLAALEGMLGGRPPPHADLGWTEIAQHLEMNEKTVKREYLRALHSLLKESSETIFGPGVIPNNYVRRILDSIRTIVYEKDLRIRNSTGRGIGVLVEKWEVALRFVLNHERVVA
jgi:hypothetical protein